MITKYTFGKEERLKSGQHIQYLLKEGQTISVFPFKIFWGDSKDPHQKFPARTAILVPKRKFKRAVDRNFMKRRIREAYRQNKNLIYGPLQEKDMNIKLVILLLADEFLSFDTLDTGIQEILGKLADKIE